MAALSHVAQPCSRHRCSKNRDQPAGSVLNQRLESSMRWNDDVVQRSGARFFYLLPRQQASRGEAATANAEVSPALRTGPAGAQQIFVPAGAGLRGRGHLPATNEPVPAGAKRSSPHKKGAVPQNKIPRQGAIRQQGLPPDCEELLFTRWGKLRVGFHAAFGHVHTLNFVFFADANTHDRFDHEPDDQ